MTITNSDTTAHTINSLALGGRQPGAVPLLNDNCSAARWPKRHVHREVTFSPACPGRGQGCPARSSTTTAAAPRPTYRRSTAPPPRPRPPSRQRHQPLALSRSEANNTGTLTMTNSGNAAAPHHHRREHRNSTCSRSRTTPAPGPPSPPAAAAQSLSPFTRAARHTPRCSRSPTTRQLAAVRQRERQRPVTVRDVQSPPFDFGTRPPSGRRRPGEFTLAQPGQCRPLIPGRRRSRMSRATWARSRSAPTPAPTPPSPPAELHFLGRLHGHRRRPVSRSRSRHRLGAADSPQTLTLTGTGRPPRRFHQRARSGGLHHRHPPVGGALRRCRQLDRAKRKPRTASTSTTAPASRPPARVCARTSSLKQFHTYHYAIWAQYKSAVSTRDRLLRAQAPQPSHRPRLQAAARRPPDRHHAADRLDVGSGSVRVLACGSSTTARTFRWPDAQPSRPTRCPRAGVQNKTAASSTASRTRSSCTPTRTSIPGASRSAPPASRCEVWPHHSRRPVAERRRRQQQELDGRAQTRT